MWVIIAHYLPVIGMLGAKFISFITCEYFSLYSDIWDIEEKLFRII